MEIDDLNSIIDKALNFMERTIQDVDEAVAKGKKVVLVSCDKGTRRGDTIDISPAFAEEEEPEIQQARVIAVNPTVAECDSYDAVCVILEPGEVTTEEEFAALYIEDTEEVLEQSDPDMCSCGADKIMCKRNQNVFGGHLQ